MKFRLKARWLVLGLLVASAGIVFYRSPDENYYDYLEDEVITIGQRVAYCLYLRGPRPPRCADLVLEPAVSAGEAGVYRELSFEEVRKRLGVAGDGVLPGDLPPSLGFAALIPELRDLRLLAFQRRADFFVMTFAYQQKPYPVVSIPGKGPLLFGVVLRYVKTPDSSLLGRTRRKAANVLGDGGGRAGTAGSVALTHFTFTAYRTDLVEWIEQNRSQLRKQTQQARQEEGVRRGQIQVGDLASLSVQAEASLVQEYEWAQRAMNDQFRDVVAYIGG